ncbi:hypothetical protein [Georgenia ruanii]|uniref:hypothetical protein n=1 Tax=Georgenia ruanii TaxID=348442 RepID=UPI0012656329|nr:hypothetical protein [Georgenia ruanii]
MESLDLACLAGDRHGAKLTLPELRQIEAGTAHRRLLRPAGDPPGCLRHPQFQGGPVAENHSWAGLATGTFATGGESDATEGLPMQRRLRAFALLAGAALALTGCGGVQDNDSPTAVADGGNNPCADPAVRDRVAAAIASTTDEAAASTLATPEDLLAAGLSDEEVAAQQAKWDTLSEEDRAFQHCLAATNAEDLARAKVDLALLEREQAEEDRLPAPHDPDDFGVDPATTRLLTTTDIGNRYWVGLQPANPAVPGREKDSVCFIVHVAAQPGMGAGCGPVETFGVRGIELGHDGQGALLVADTHDDPGAGWAQVEPNLYFKEPGAPAMPRQTSEPLSPGEAKPYEALVRGTDFVPVRIERNSIARSSFIDACFDDGRAGTTLCFALHLDKQAALQIQAWEEGGTQRKVQEDQGYQPFDVEGGTGIMRADEWAVAMRVRSDDGAWVAYVNLEESNPAGSVPSKSVDFVRDVFIPELLKLPTS